LALGKLLWGPAIVACMACWCPVAAEEGSLRPPTSLQHRALGFLKSLPREWSGTSNRDCKTYEAKNLDLLSPTFAISAAAFLKAFTEVHGHVTVTSAHRSAQEQTCVCEGEKGPCAGRPRVVKIKKKKSIVVRSTSNHQRGMALDVRAGTGSEDEFACLHEFAQFNPQFGVRFPMGLRDKPHMEPATKATKQDTRVASLGALTATVVPCAKIKGMLADDVLD
jgi:hypothetical protein